MSTQSQDNNKRIAKNTFFMYIRMVVVMTITLFTSRIILQSLGVEDFGIYNVVGGVITMFSFLNASLSEGTQRFITYELGKGSHDNVRKVFSTCVFLHIILGLIIVIIAEPVGVWFLTNKLLIPATRMDAAMFIYQISIISAFAMIITVPYYSLIIAHEKMKAFAFISVIEAIAKLLIAYVLLGDRDYDKLIFYGFGMLLIQVMIQLIYFIYCRIKLCESKIMFCFDMTMFKSIASFSSWTIVGSVAYIGVTQGLNLLLGTFFFPAVNAARGIAVQVQNAVNTFVKNFQVAINPQITKSYASGDIIAMHSLIFRSARFSFFLLLFPILPILLEADLILYWWLHDVPQYTVDFVRVILLVSWINCLGNPLGIAARASGNIRRYEMYAASIKLLVIPVGYICLKSGMPPVSVFLVYLFFELTVLLSNIYVTSTLVNYKVALYYKQVILRVVIVAIISSIAPLLCHLAIEPPLVRFFVTIVVSVMSSVITIYFGGLQYKERLFFNNKFITIKNKFKKQI